MPFASVLSQNEQKHLMSCVRQPEPLSGLHAVLVALTEHKIYPFCHLFIGSCSTSRLSCDLVLQFFPILLEVGPFVDSLTDEIFDDVVFYLVQRADFDLSQKATGASLEFVVCIIEQPTEMKINTDVRFGDIDCTNPMVKIVIEGEGQLSPFDRHIKVVLG